MEILYVDGGCAGNGQLDVAARKMVSVVTDAHGQVLSEKSEAGGSNNIAELLAVRDALQVAVDRGFSHVLVRTDSRNNFAWVGGRLGKKLNDRARVETIQREIAQLRQRVLLDLQWVSRENNKAGHYLERTYTV